MSNKNKWILGAIIVVLLLMLVVNRNSKKSDESADSVDKMENVVTDYKIGVVLPLTGDAASYGEPAKQIYEIAKEEINANGGIKGGKLELVYQDGKCNGADAANAAKQLIEVEKVQALIGGFCSGESLAIVPLAESAKVAMYNATSSSPALTGKSKYFIRNYPSDDAQGKGLAEYANNMGYKNMGMLVEQTDYALGIAKVFETSFNGFNGKITREEFAKEGTDFRTQLTKLKAGNFDAMLIIAQTPTSAERITKQIRDLAWKPKLLINDVYISDDKMVEANKDILDGVVFMTFAGDITNPKAKQMIDAYKSKYNKEPLYFDSYGLSEYDIVYMMADALKSVGYNGEKIAEFGRTFKDWDGATGKVTINQDGDRENVQFVKKTVKDGKVEIVK